MEPQPKLVSGSVCHRWGYSNPVTGEPIGTNEDALRDMCDYGAEQVAAGKCDFLAIDCMPGEVAFIKAYMAERHPAVGYAFGSGQRVLREATERWRAQSTPQPPAPPADHP